MQLPKAPKPPKVPFEETLKSAAVIVAIAVSVIACIGMLSQYPGFIKVKVGVSGGELTIDGRQPPPPDALK